MIELVDILDPITGEITGKTIYKDDAHKDGTWHGSIHILIIDNNKEKIY